MFARLRASYATSRCATASRRVASGSRPSCPARTSSSSQQTPGAGSPWLRAAAFPSWTSHRTRWSAGTWPRSSRGGRRPSSTSRELSPPAEREEIQRGLTARFMSGEPVMHVDSALVTKDGRRRDIEASIIRVTEDGAARLVTIVRDVTDQRRAQEAQRDSEAKSRLMAMMNHEVRTPLNSILGFAQLLTDPRIGELTEKQRRYVANIKAAGDHLLQLANDSLDMAKLDAGRAGMVLSVVPVDTVVSQAVEQVRPMANAQGLTLDAELSPGLDVHADARHLTQVLLNLLSNAIRHTHAGSVTVSARRDGDSVAISVSDTGDGISQEDLVRIFEEFFQGGNHAPGGIGLGLSISKRLVHLMGGSIGVESELGKGSTFTVRLAAAT